MIFDKRLTGIRHLLCSTYVSYLAAIIIINIEPAF